MSHLNVLIVEDESYTAEWLEKLLYEYDPEITVLAQLPSVDKSVNWFRSYQPVQPDLIFLDIHLEDDLGFRLIEQLNLTIPVIFTTAHAQYALQAFKANSIDYLLKPISLDELTLALDKFQAIRMALTRSLAEQGSSEQVASSTNSSGYRDRFMVSVGPKLRSIQTGDIGYFFFENKATFLMPHSGHPLPIDYSLEKLGQLLNPSQFFRINRSFLVSISAIQSVHTYSGSKLKVELYPTPHQEAFVSVDRVTEFKDWLGR